MSHEFDALQRIWLGQPDEKEFAMSIDDVRARDEVFQSRIARRNLVEYVATAFVVVAFGIQAVMTADLLVRSGAVLCALGALVLAWNLRRRAHAASRAEMANAASSWAEFHRSELVRQRDALRSVWLWYLAPLVSRPRGFDARRGLGHLRRHATCRPTGAFRPWLCRCNARLCIRGLAQR